MTRELQGRYGKLVVIGPVEYRMAKNGRKRKQVKVKCDCGNIKTVSTDSLAGGSVRSCGCLVRQGLRKTHGESRTRLYRIYHSMKNRCYNKHDIGYKHYGGRGIGMCENWSNDYMSFRDWAVSNGYKENLSIDRIDVNSGYGPENCRWSTNLVQANNKRPYRDNASGYTGVYSTANGKFRSMFNFDGKRINVGIFLKASDAFKYKEDLRELLLLEYSKTSKEVI